MTMIKLWLRRIAWIVGIKFHCPIHADKVLFAGEFCTECFKRNEQEKIKLHEENILQIINNGERTARALMAARLNSKVDTLITRSALLHLVGEVSEEYDRHADSCHCTLCVNFSLFTQHAPRTEYSFITDNIASPREKGH